MTEWEISSEREEVEGKRVWTEELKLGLLLTELVIWNGSLGTLPKARQKICVASANLLCISNSNGLPKQ